MDKKQKKYYSSRIKGSSIDFDKLFELVRTTYYYFRDKDYFKEKLGITYNNIPDHAKSKSAIALRENILPIKDWYFCRLRTIKFLMLLSFFTIILLSLEKWVILPVKLVLIIQTTLTMILI